jgi:hypothetical protein
MSKHHLIPNVQTPSCPQCPNTNSQADVPHGASAVAALNSLRKGTHDEDKANALFDKIAGLSVRLGFTMWGF